MPTKDSARYTFLMDLCIQDNQPLLMVGPTGTGKSVYINRHLISTLPKDKWLPIFITLSARTTANMTQEQVDGRLDKRRKGVYGPPLGKRAILFVDDLNMPSKETYGAQVWSYGRHTHDFCHHHHHHYQHQHCRLFRRLP